MAELKIQAEPRATGKKAARAARREGFVPAVVYGHHVEPVAIKVRPRSLAPLIRAHETYRIELEVDGKKFNCILKDVQFHPLTDEPIHADFQVLRAGEKIYLTVPVHIVGTPKGVEQGGEMVVLLHELEIEALPKDIPPYVEIDVTELEIGDAIHAGDISIPNVTILTPPEQAIVTIVGRAAEAGEEAEEAGGEEEATE